MSDDLSTGNLWNPRSAKSALFYGVYAAASATPVSQVWQKPKNASFLYLLAISSGGGGGAGASGGANAAGGSGGACSTISTLVLPAYLCPPLLYVNVPLGGLGSTGSGAGSGAPSTISTVQSSTSGKACVLVSANTTTTGGNDGAAGAGGGTVTTPSAPTGTDHVLSLFGSLMTSSGATSGVGGTSAAGGNALFMDGVTILSCGAGGGGVNGGADTNGGNVVSNSPGTVLIPTILGGQSAGASGNPGYQTLGLSTLWCFTGGAGGASNLIGQGGAGGAGAIGCGGGGGGGGLTRGPGGNGGGGLAMILWW